MASYYSYYFMEFYDEAGLKMMYTFIYLIVFYIVITTLLSLNIFKTLTTRETDEAER